MTTIRIQSDEYLKVAYSPNNGYEARNMRSFKARRFTGKNKKSKLLITSGRINYFMSEEEKQRITEKVSGVIMENTDKMVLK